MEPLILYFVLFFPTLLVSPFAGIGPESVSFSVLRELGRTVTYTVPALALLWYIMSDKNGFSALRKEKPGFPDLPSFAAGFPALVIIGIAISLLVSRFSGLPWMTPPPLIESPATIPGWIVLVISCLGTGYLEESYFRYYLLTWMENPVPNAALRIFFSTALFAICHIYEGPWGIINAALAGIVLSVLFTRFRSLHGIAWAHGGYNIFVYVMGNFIS